MVRPPCKAAEEDKAIRATDASEAQIIRRPFDQPP
jgi:hypothetical protein